MKKLFAAVAMAAVTCFTQAGVVFDNGAPVGDSTWCISGPNVCQGSGTWSVYDQFTLTSATTVSGFANWNNGGNTTAYTVTNWSIWTNTPTNGGTALYSGSSVATLSSDRGYVLAAVNGLSINLTAGNYWLGINHTLQDGKLWTYAYGGNESNAIQLDGATWAFSDRPDMAFVITSVPEAETYAMLITGLGLLGAISRRRKQS